MFFAPRAILRSIVATALVALAVNVVSNSRVNGAPIGSPVSVTRNVTMGGSNISNLIYDGTYLWVVEYGANQVERINPSTGAIVGSPIPVGANPGAVLIVNGHLFVANSGSNTVTDINLTTATVTRTISLTGSAIAGLVYDGTYIWAISYSSSKAERFNPSTGALVGSALNVAPNPGGGTIVNGHLFIPGSGGSTLTDIDVSTASITRTITLSGSNLASATYDGTNLWVSMFNNASVARVNPATGAVLGYTSVGSNPTNVIYANGSIWVGATGTDTVTQISTSGTVTRTIHLGSGNISNLVYDGEVIWAPNFNGAYISQINATSGSVDANTPAVGSNPGAVALINNSVWVASTGSNRVTQISGPVPTTTTAAPTTTTTAAPTTTTVAPTSTIASSSTSSVPTTTPIGVATTVVASGSTTSGGANSGSTTAVTPGTTAPLARSSGLPGSATTTTVRSTTTTVPAPEIPNVSSGASSVTVGDEVIATELRRLNNQIEVNAGDVKALISGVDGTTTVPLDTDGNIRLLPGQSISFTSTGFAPESEVATWMFSTPTQLGTTMSDATGFVSGKYQIPVNAVNGSHRIALIGRSADGYEVKVVLGIKVGKETTSNVATWLIALPLSAAILVAIFLPAVLRRRRRTA
jgi:YVTN family beta-propeller protein